MEEGCEKELERAKDCYLSIKEGYHESPEEAFEGLQYLLEEIGCTGQYHLLDSSLPEDSDAAEAHIRNVVIPRSCLLRALLLHDETRGRLQEIEHFYERYRELSGNADGPATFQGLNTVLDELATQLREEVAVAKLASRPASVAYDLELRELLSESDRKNSYWVSKLGSGNAVKDLTPPQYAMGGNGEFSASISFSLGGAVDDKQAALYALRDKFTGLLEDEGVKKYNVTTALGDDKHYHVITAKVNASYQSELKSAASEFVEEVTRGKGVSRN